MKREKDKIGKFINVHCHLLNFEFIPDSFFSNYGVPEKFIKSRFTIFLIKLLKYYLILRNMIRGNIPYYLVDTWIPLLRNEIIDIRKEYAKEMYEAEIILSTPLMMDIEFATLGQKPECPYRLQIQIISELIAKRYLYEETEPFIMMPFIMYDPRREAVKIGTKKTETDTDLEFPVINGMIKGGMQKALEDYGFLGVKMYPALGYHPDPGSIYNIESVNNELDNTYKYCNDNRIPITTHCSRDGAYSSELMGSKQSVKFLSNPSYWEGVIKEYPGINFNFAHFGGGWDFLGVFEKRWESWALVIIEFMREYHNVYADVSSHSGALMRRISRNYFKDLTYDPIFIKTKSYKDYFKILNFLLKDKLIKDRILFGTDWPMTRHSWHENAYVNAFYKGIGEENFEKIAVENPLKFLFPEGKVPERIKDFHKENEIGNAAIRWLDRRMTAYNK